MIVIADAGPLLHLYWVDALEWALPPQEIIVVEEVWKEVEKYAARALENTHLRRHKVGLITPPQLSSWNLDPGELAALTCAVEHAKQQRVLVLCDELEARNACAALDISFVGSVGLIVEAVRSRRIDRSTGRMALKDLPDRGRLHVKQEVIQIALNEI